MFQLNPVALNSLYRSYGVLGGTSFPPLGTFSEYVAVSREEVVPTPSHLTDEQAAAFPLAGLTAWRYANSSPFHRFIANTIHAQVGIRASTGQSRSKYPHHWHRRRRCSRCAAVLPRAGHRCLRHQREPGEDRPGCRARRQRRGIV